jgi:A1 cistron-splicing factor AAR2
MDAEEAKRLLLAGGILILEQLPAGSEFGIDCTVQQIGEQFKGVKMIPPGLHLIHYSLADRHGQQSPKVGFFATFKAQSCVLRTIDADTEEPSEDSVDDQMRTKYSFANVPYFDRHLAPYALDTYRDWLQLTTFLDVDLVSDLQPLNGLIDSVRQQLPQQYRSDRTEGRQVDATERPDPFRCFRFTPLTDRFDRPTGCSAADLSTHSCDSSYTLTRMLEAGSERRLLGELQFAFVTFLLCHVYESFEQWKRLLRLLCHGRSLLSQRPSLYVQLIRVLHFQLQRVPPDLFVDIVEQDNFLFRCLRELFENVAELEPNELTQQLIRRSDAFKRHVTDEFGWDLDAELDDEAPAVLDQPQTDAKII